MKALTEKIIDELEIEYDKHLSDTDGYLESLDFAIKTIKNLEKDAEFDEVARVVMKHMANPKRYHPHHTVIITSTTAELLEGKQTAGQIMDYITD